MLSSRPSRLRAGVVTTLLALAVAVPALAGCDATAAPAPPPPATSQPPAQGTHHTPGSRTPAEQHGGSARPEPRPTSERPAPRPTTRPTPPPPGPSGEFDPNRCPPVLLC